jgi:hypothetical protein
MARGPKRTPEQIALYQKRYREAHREEIRRNAKKYRDAHRDKPAHLMKKYGITVAHKEMMFEEQKGLCAVCKEPLIAVHDRDTCVDHCHTSKKVRGLVHWYCNILVGVFEKKPVLYTRVQDYVSQHS